MNSTALQILAFGKSKNNVILQLYFEVKLKPESLLCQEMILEG